MEGGYQHGAGYLYHICPMAILAQAGSKTFSCFGRCGFGRVYPCALAHLSALFAPRIVDFGDLLILFVDFGDYPEDARPQRAVLCSYLALCSLRNRR